MDISIYELLWLFFLYSVLGWCASVAVTAVKRKQFINTGVLSLPLCPMYGIGAVAFRVLLPDLLDAPLFLFIGGIVISSFLNVVTGVVLEHIFHRRWWDYSEKKFGFGGFLTAPLLLAFGAETLLVMYVGNPLFIRIIRLVPRSIGKVILLGLLVLLGIDISGALAVVWKWRRHVNRVAGLTENMQQVSESFGNAIVRAVCRRLERSYPNLETRKLLEAKAARGKEEQTCFAQGCSFYKLFWLFLIGSFLGDLVETVFCRYSLGYWMSRSSVVYGPFSVVWGLGCALLTAFLYKYKDKSDRFIFFYGTVVGGAYEYLCSVGTEILFGASFWDYSKIPFNLGGRINLLYCFFWGFAAVIWLKGVYPFLSGWIEKIPKKTGVVLSWVLIVLMCANMAISAFALVRYTGRQLGQEPKNQLEQMIDERFPDDRMARIYPKAKVVVRK